METIQVLVKFHRYILLLVAINNPEQNLAARESNVFAFDWDRLRRNSSHHETGVSRRRSQLRTPSKKRLSCNHLDFCCRVPRHINVDDKGQFSNSPEKKTLTTTEVPRSHITIRFFYNDMCKHILNAQVYKRSGTKKRHIHF